MAFHFRLDPVLRHRKRLEDTAALDLARAEQRREAVRGRLTVLWAEVAAWREELAATADRGATGMELGRLARAVENLRDLAERCTAELQAEGERVAQAREELIKAARARRSIQLLEDVAREAHAQRIRVLEQRQTDEVGTIGYLWRRAQASADAGERS